MEQVKEIINENDNIDKNEKEIDNDINTNININKSNKLNNIQKREEINYINENNKSKLNTIEKQEDVNYMENNKDINNDKGDEVIKYDEDMIDYEEKENSENQINDNEEKENSENNINDNEEKENSENQINDNEEKEFSENNYEEYQNIIKENDEQQNDNEQNNINDERKIENTNFNIKSKEKNIFDNQEVNSIQLQIHNNKNNNKNDIDLNDLNGQYEIINKEELEKEYLNKENNELEKNQKIMEYEINPDEKNKQKRESKKKKNIPNKIKKNQKNEFNEKLPKSNNRIKKKTSERNSSHKNYRRNKKYDNKFRNEFDIFGFKDHKKKLSHRTVSKPQVKLFTKNDKFNSINSNKTNYTYVYDYKNQKEIFPTLVGSDIPIIRKFEINEDKYRKYSRRNEGKYNYNPMSKNPFEGPSQYERTHKERKNLIAQTVKKEENDFSEIANIEQAIYNKKSLKKEELNQLIYYFIDILYKDVDKLLNNKEGLVSYNYKINRIAKIVDFMDNIDQIKVMESLQKTADSYNKMELYERLSEEVEEIKNMRKSKLRKSDFSSGGIKEGYSFRAQIRKTLKKSIK